MYEMGRHIHARVLRSEKGKIRVTHVQTRSDCVHTRDDTVRLNYASRFVRVIYSSHIVSIKLDTVTNNMKKKGKRRKKTEKKTLEKIGKNIGKQVKNRGGETRKKTREKHEKHKNTQEKHKKKHTHKKT